MSARFYCNEFCGTIQAEVKQGKIFMESSIIYGMDCFIILERNCKPMFVIITLILKIKDEGLILNKSIIGGDRMEKRGRQLGDVRCGVWWCSFQVFHVIFINM